jgi:dihydrofolate reductase
MDWMTMNWSEDLIQYVTELTHSFDTILLGRNLAQGFIPHWANVAANPDNPEHESGKIFSNTPKVVFTKTLESSDWAHTVLAKGDLTTEVNKLKNQPGKDLIAYGGGQFVSSLIREKLIDELHLFVNPAVIGSGMPIFQEVAEKQSYELLGAKPFSCGIVVLTYKPV